MHTVHHGKSNTPETVQFVQKITQNSEGEAPLFLREGWKASEDALAPADSDEEPVPYAGRGRPRNPVRVVDAHLK